MSELPRSNLVSALRSTLPAEAIRRSKLNPPHPCGQENTATFRLPYFLGRGTRKLAQASSACLKIKYLRCFIFFTALRRTLRRLNHTTSTRKQQRHKCHCCFLGGEGGIRTLGRSPYAGFQDRYHQPLGHLSVTLSIIACPTGVYNRIKRMNFSKLSGCMS